MTIKIEYPNFQSNKEKHRYIKTVITEIDKQFNKHTFDLGDWPLMIQTIDDKFTDFLSLRFCKALELDENATQTMNSIIAYIKKDLQLKIHNIERL